MIESKGDYRSEVHLERVIGGRLYENQTTLRNLPIPTLKDTIDRFLPTALPLATNNEEKRSLFEACSKFPNEASTLQKRLLDRRNLMKDSSWLQCWWNTVGYLQVRDTIVVNVSYFFHLSDDDSLPLSNGGKSHGVMRGASILVAVAEYRKKVCTGNLQCETIGKKENRKALCSVAFKYMFNACRIPQKKQDTYRIYDPSLYTHCVVAYKGQFFSVDFTNENGDPLPLSLIENRLQKCVDMVEEQKDTQALGILTSSDRDSWAHARSELLRLGGVQIKSALEVMESGAILLCLDDEEPVSREQCANIFWTGGLTSGHNRWFDKSIQIVCTKNGKAGLIGEHSMMDGMPVIGLADHITRVSYRDALQKSKTMDSRGSSNSCVFNIFQGCLLDSRSKFLIDGMVEKSFDAFKNLVNDHSLSARNFQKYGSNYIKKSGFSPDAYFQVAIQLATYRLFKTQVGTYEATQVRSFLHGRTETTRSVSQESKAFVELMGFHPKHGAYDPDARKKKSHLASAIKSHVKYISCAANGIGVDRHFFGLSMLTDNEEKLPALYNDPVFARSKTWRVSTSHLTHPKFENWGYGEVVPNGVGLAYGIKPDNCIFNITALQKNDWTDTLSHLLEEALVEMKALNDFDKIPMSKL